MNFLNLEYFLITAEELNFTKAAKRLYISQQSLSKHIARLEEHFGLQLFDRTPPLTLTPAGQSLVKSARRLLDIRKEAELELHDIKDFRTGNLSIGVTHARGTVLLPMLLPTFHHLYPHVKLKLVEGTSPQLDEALLGGEVDITIGFKPADAVNVQSEPVLEEKSALVVPRQILEQYLPQPNGEIGLAAITPEDILRHCPFVTIHASTWAGALFERYCRKMAVTPQVLVETVNIATMVALCREGMGAIICPEIFLHSRKMPQAVIYPLDIEPDHHVITLNYLKNKYRSHAAREFIRLAKTILTKKY